MTEPELSSPGCVTAKYGYNGKRGVIQWVIRNEAPCSQASQWKRVIFLLVLIHVITVKTTARWINAAIWLVLYVNKSRFILISHVLSIHF